jgi:ligand-binding sensor domain-containing protein
MAMAEKRRQSKGLLSAAFLAVILLSAAFSSSAQTYPYREYTTEDGLPQSQSLGVMQDSRGFLWIPTRNGLARFDGHTFISYYRKDGLTSNIVSKVIEDAAGVIWAITPSGVSRFNGVAFYGYPLPESTGMKQVSFTCLSEKPGVFFMSGSDTTLKQKIILFDNGTYQNFSASDPLLADRSFKVMACDRKDSVLYIADEESKLYRYGEGRLTLINKGPVEQVTSGDSLVIRMLPADPTFNIGMTLPNWEYGNIIADATDREGVRWISTESRIYRLVSEAFTEYDIKDGLPQSPWAIAADPVRGLWIGSVNGDLVYFDGKKFIPRMDFAKFFSHGIAFYRGSLTLSNGEVWLSTNEGVIIWDGKKFRRPDLLPRNLQVCIIYEDPVDRTIFVGTDFGLFHIKGRNIVCYNQLTSSGLGVTEGVTRDHNGNYWIAGHYGIVFFDGKKFTPFRSSTGPSEMAWGVLCDYRGTIWTVSSEGVYTCNPENPFFTEALPGELNLPANVIRDMGDHRLLVGRMLDICIIDLDKYYSGDPDYYTIIGRSRGFTGNDCQDNGIVRDAAGDWWLLASDKLIHFDPEKVKKNIYPPTTHITKVELAGDSLAWKSVADSIIFYNTDNTITLKGTQEGLRITYTGISTSDPEDVTFEYRMKGLNDQWSARTAERSVTFNDLSPGKYTFEVNSFNSDDVMSPEPDKLQIIVAPTFIQSKFAKILFVLIALIVVAHLSFLIRKRVLESRIEMARQQAETYRLQLNSVIKQLDPHFTFNALTSVGSLIMKGEKEKTYNYFTKLSNLLRSVLSDSSVLLKPLKEETEFVTRYCELQKLRFGSRFDYSINVAGDVDLNMPVPKMIIQSFAENAVKHGIENKKESGILTIRITNAGNGAEVTIRDNGIGRQAAREFHTEGSGIGLKNINGIIEMMNKVNTGKITIDLKDLFDGDRPSGTEVRIFLPYNYSFDSSQYIHRQL